MIEVNGEQYNAPEGVDDSLEALRARLMELQPSLRSLMGKALELFDDVFPRAPHPADAPDSLVYAVSTANYCPTEHIPMARELTVVLGAGKWVRIFRTTDSAPNAYPRQALWLTRPEGNVSRRVDIMRTHAPTRADYPYNVETVDYDNKGMCLGFVGGASYYGQESFIAETGIALNDALQVAQDQGFITGR